MVECSKVNVKLTDRQLKQLKTAVEKKTGTAVRMSLKMFDWNNLPHELLLTTRQKTKLRNPFNDNMFTDLTTLKAQISKIIQSGEFLGSLLSKLAGPLMKIAVPLAKNDLAPLTRIFSSNNSSCFSIRCRNTKKIHGFGTTTLIISNEEINDIMKTVQAPEDSKISLKE